MFDFATFDFYFKVCRTMLAECLGLLLLLSNFWNNKFNYKFWCWIGPERFWRKIWSLPQVSALRVSDLYFFLINKTISKLRNSHLIIKIPSFPSSFPSPFPFHPLGSSIKEIKNPAGGEGKGMKGKEREGKGRKWKKSEEKRTKEKWRELEKWRDRYDRRETLCLV